MVERVLGVGLELDGGSRSVLLEVMDMARPGGRHDEIALRQQPREAKMRRGAALGRGMRLQFLDQRQIAGEVVALEARHPAARVALAQRVERGDVAGEKPTAERAVGDKADAQ